MMADGNSGREQAGDAVTVFDLSEEDVSLDLDMIFDILEESDPPAPQYQQEGAQNFLINGEQVGSVPDSGNQMNFHLQTSADISSTTYETESQSRHVEGDTNSGENFDYWIDSSNNGFVNDGSVMENSWEVSGSENGTEQFTNMALGDATVHLQGAIPSTSSFSLNSDLSSDFDEFYPSSGYFPQHGLSGEFNSDKVPGNEALMIDTMSEIIIPPTEGFELSGVLDNELMMIGGMSEMSMPPTESFGSSGLMCLDPEGHGFNQESHTDLKFGSYVYDGGQNETSIRPCSSNALGHRGKPPVFVHPKHSTSSAAPAMLRRYGTIKAEKVRSYLKVEPRSSEVHVVSYTSKNRDMNIKSRDQHFARVRRYGTPIYLQHGLKDEAISQRSFPTAFSRVSPESTHSNSSGSQSIVDDDSDLCILEDISQPPRSSHSQPFKKPIDSFQPISHSDSYHYNGAGVRPRVCDERVLFRVALQDLNQPKSEAIPPDGFMAVPLMRHQRIALSWMVHKETSGIHCSGGILADDQGLGKTISTIALILKERAPCHGADVAVVKKEKFETLNLDDDEDGIIEVKGIEKGSGDCAGIKKEGSDCGAGTKKEGSDSGAGIKKESSDSGAGIKKESSDCGVMSYQNASKSINLLGQSKGRPAAGTLIVCPTSVLRQWAEELHKKVTTKANLSVLVYHGSNRTKDPHELSKFDVVLTTYSIVSMEVPKQPFADGDDEEKARAAGDDPPLGSSGKKRKYPLTSGKKGSKKKESDSALFETLARPLAKVAWFRVVLDEAQSIKNHRTQVARACWGLRAKRRWCLSGTPLQNAIDDLYSYFRFLRYDPFTVFTEFCNGIKLPIQRSPAKGYRKLQAILKTVMLRRTKATLLDGEPIITLPPKFIELKRVEFTDEERCFYSRLENDSRDQFKEYAAAGTVRQNYVNILLMLLRLRQACDHPLLVRGYESAALERSTIEMAKKLPHEKRMSLLHFLEASLAICGLCNDPPEDAVVSICGHVFCNQCICEHLNGDDNHCPTPHCKVPLNVSSVFSQAILHRSLADQSSEAVFLPSPDAVFLPPTDAVDEVSSRAEAGGPYDSSKIRAALAVLQSISRPQQSASEKLSEQDSANNLKGSGTGEKAIVFSQWTRMLDLLEACLKSSSIQYRRLDGTMSVVARDKAVKDFNTLPEVSVIIMSLKAASLGLNMVAACHVMLLDLWWNPTTEDQAIDRAHRIGQTRPVKVLRLTVKDTVEDRILALQQKKRTMVASAFGEDRNGGRQTRLTEEDLRYLFMG
ncbi:unnamed protein product [Linum trigynum]|uniref:Helicase-like transcription factor CHR28 n=1 Tax=Linum trigynum TaxID=586398 RepID=A0AAV2DHH8_9ROSI